MTHLLSPTTFRQRIIGRGCLARFSQLNALFRDMNFHDLERFTYLDCANWHGFFQNRLYFQVFGDFRCAPVLVVLRVLDVLTVLLGFLRGPQAPRNRS